MRMMVVVVGLSALMGWQGIPLRLASLAASPLRFAKGEHLPSLPLYVQGETPPSPLMPKGEHKGVLDGCLSSFRAFTTSFRRKPESIPVFEP